MTYHCAILILTECGKCGKSLRVPAQPQSQVLPLHATAQVPALLQTQFGLLPVPTLPLSYGLACLWIWYW